MVGIRAERFVNWQRARSLETMADALIPVIKRAIDTRVNPLTARVTAIEHRQAVHEAKPHVKFCGVWQRDQPYAAGDAVVRKGGLWICKAATTGEPGHDFDA